MKVDLSLSQYIEWEVTKVFQIKGKYGYRVNLKYIDGSIKVQQKSGFVSQKEASEARDRTVGELYNGSYIVFQDVLVKQFLEFWLEEDIKQRVGSYSTYDSFRKSVKNHIIPVIGNKKVAELNRGHIQALYHDVFVVYEYAAHMVKTVMNISMRYAKDKKFIAENPAVGVSLPKAAKKKGYHTRNIESQKTLTLDQIYILIEASKNTPIYLMVLFNVLMGLRCGEIIGLKYSDIDYTDQTITVCRQLGRDIKKTKEQCAPKTYTKQEIRVKTNSSNRVLKIPDLVFDAIMKEREIYEGNMRRRKKEFVDAGYICCSSYGRARSKGFHHKHYKRLLKENGLPDIRWHDLRSTYCTLLLKNNFNPKAVSNLMGHAKEIITIDVYGDNEQLAIDCTEEIDLFLDELHLYNKEETCSKIEQIEVDYSDLL